RRRADSPSLEDGADSYRHRHRRGAQPVGGGDAPRIRKAVPHRVDQCNDPRPVAGVVAARDNFDGEDVLSEETASRFRSPAPTVASGRRPGFVPDRWGYDHRLRRLARADLLTAKGEACRLSRMHARPTPRSDSRNLAVLRSLA